MKFSVLWEYCKARPLVAAGLLYVLDAGAWLTTVVVSGPSPVPVTQFIVCVSMLIMIICAIADEEGFLPAAIARTMLVAGFLLFVVGAFLNGDGIWYKGALLVGTTVVSMCGVMLHAHWQEQHEEPLVEDRDERQVENQLTE